MPLPVPARLALGAGLTAALLVATPLTADAHVRIYPKQAVAGADDTLLTFSVPNESATATTTRVVIELPTATPFGDVGYQPVPGWSARVVTAHLAKPAKVDGATVTEAPVRVVWTADAGTKLLGGQFQDFVLTVGPMPDTGRILLPTRQTYSDGSTVAWTQPTRSTGEEPEHPAPTLYVDDTPPAADRTPGATVSAAASPQSQTITDVAIGVAAAATVIALMALVLAIAALIRLRRSPTR